MQLIDTHAHLDAEHFGDKLGDVIERAKRSQLVAMICVGTTASTSRSAVALANQEPTVWASVGIQPNYCHEASEDDWDTIVELSNDSRVVAIGETGLDRYWKDCPWEIQQEFFQRHWMLSQQTDLPVIIHMRDCGPEVVMAIQAASFLGPTRGVMHSFTGDWEVCRACLDLGLYISFAGMLTYKKSEELREVARKVPLDRLLVETDSPYLSPEPKRGHRPNEPSLVIHTLECLAMLHRVSTSDLARQTTSNALTLFSRMSIGP